jgi:colanic acid/amylovoran biosynthesis protein
LLPQTLGPFRSRVARQVARFVLKRAELVYSRDYAGIETARQLVRAPAGTETIRFCNDVAFVLTPKAPAKVDIVGLPTTLRGAGLVGVNISGLLAIGGYARKNMFGLACDYNALVARVIELFVKKNARVLLVPHVFGTHEESDSLACERAYVSLRLKYGGRLGFLRSSYNQHEIKHIIGRCDFFIGSRMHACIAAMSQAVPAVAIAYSDKFVGVMQTFGAESLVADARVFNENQVVELVERTYNNRQAVRSLLQENIRGISARVVHEFGTFLNGNCPAPVSDGVVIGSASE